MAASTTHKNTMSSFLLLITIVSLLLGLNSAQPLSADFYSATCPNALSIIKSAISNAVNSEARMGGSLLRLHFHDCFVNLGGPSWRVLLGRRDSTTASKNATNANLPRRDSSLSQLIEVFANKGFSARKMVALSGSHTIGLARCTFFRNRIYNEPNINASFVTSLKANCPINGGDNNLGPLDTTTPTTFDNAYYKNLQGQKGLFHSNQQLFSDRSTDSIVNAYSSDPYTFATDFANAMVKMGNLSPLTGTSGQITLIKEHG